MANEENGILSNSEIASQVISKYTGTNSQNNKRKNVNVNKNDEEYTRKRARNNIAVKKSREKAKTRILETQTRVEQLSQENEELQTKVTLLSKELNVLRALFTNGGFTSLPCDLQYLNSDSEHNGNSDTLHTSHHHITSHIQENPLHHSLSSSHLPSTFIATNKTNSKTEDSKIPPLRPMPRVINDVGIASRSTAESNHSPVSGKSFSFNERDTEYPYTHNKSTIYKDFVKVSAISSSNISSASTSPTMAELHTEYNNGISSYKVAPETQHTSVIRDATKMHDSKISSSNTLGKFCIIQDPENNGQVKIVPMNT